MTNEEIVIEIQRGRSDLYGQLWEQVRGFVAQLSYRRYQFVEDRGGIDVEDLVQAGYLGVVSAVESFDPEGGYSFLTALSKHLKTAFNDACGVRYERLAKDPLHFALSLDVPVDDEDPDGPTLGDLQAGADDVEGAATETVFREELRAAIEKLLAKMNPTAADVIRAKYLTGEPVEETAERYGLTVKGLATRRTGYWNQLCVKARTTPEGKDLRRFLDDNTNFYMQIGPDSFNRTHTSAPEYLAMMREDLENIYRGKTK